MSEVQQDASAKQTPSVFDWWSKASAPLRMFRHAIALLFWTYVVVKPFIFDVDIYLVSRVDSALLWVLDYKLMFFLGVIALAFILTRNVRILFWIIYVLGYPLLIVARSAYYFVAWIAARKSWNLALFAVNVAFGIFRAFKNHFVILVGAALAAAVIAGSSDGPTLFGAAIALILLNLILIAHGFASVFDQTGVFLLHTKLTGFALGNLKKPLEGEQEIRTVALAELKEEEKKKFVGRLEHAMMFHEGCKFWAGVLDRYKWSGLNIILYINVFVVLVAVTVVFTAFETMALFKAAPEGFAGVERPRFFDFFYYAFKGMFLQTTELTAVGDIARVFSIVQTSLSFILISLFLSLFVALRRELDDKSAETAIKNLDAQASDIAAYISQQFALSIDQAASELDALKSSVSGIVGWLRNARQGLPSQIARPANSTATATRTSAPAGD